MLGMLPPSIVRPVNGHQNAVVLVNAPSKTRWKNMPMGTPSKLRRVAEPRRQTTITSARTATLAVTEWNTHTPPVGMSTTSGSSAPTINVR